MTLPMFAILFLLIILLSYSRWRSRKDPSFAKGYSFPKIIVGIIAIALIIAMGSVIVHILFCAVIVAIIAAVLKVLIT